MCTHDMPHVCLVRSPCKLPSMWEALTSTWGHNAADDNPMPYKKLESRASYTPLPCLLNLLTSHVSLHSFQGQPRYIAKHTTRLLNHWRVHMCMSCSGGSRVTVCECRAGCDVAGAGGCQRPLEGQEAACQEGGCSPASSCLQVCKTHSFCTLGNPGWTGNLRIMRCSLQ